MALSDANSTGPASKVRATETAYRGLRALIVNGGYPAGAHLREERVAGRLGVSRTPVREAIRRLAAEGWVRIVPNQGAYVYEWSKHDVEEVFALRAMLEGHAAECAAINATTLQIDELFQLSQGASAVLPAKNVEDIERIAEFNDRFHKLILEASGQRRAAAAVFHLVELPITLRNFHQFTAAEMGRSISQHHAIVDAIAAGDAQWAGAIMRAHVLGGKALFMERMETAPTEDAPMKSSGANVLNTILAQSEM